MSKIDFEELLFAHNLQADALEKAGLNPDDLQSINDDHLSQISDLERVGDFVIGQLRRAGEVHSLKYRVKAPEHLVAKIIRKRLDEPERIISLENYKQEITDLVGIRALHLYKEDWGGIHDYIKSTWDLHEPPTANYREGDPAKWLEAFTARECKTRCHPAGYRSVHYLIKSQPTKNIYIAEVQVRTIFEEAWSEVDHRIRYPDDLNNPVLAPLLLIFNRLAGSADEIASYIQVLKAVTEEDKRLHEQALRERDLKVAELIAQVEQLEIATEDKAKIKEELEDINTYDPKPSISTTPLTIRQMLGLDNPFAGSGPLTGKFSGLGLFGVLGETNQHISEMMKSVRIAANLSASLPPGSITGSLLPRSLASERAASRAINESLEQIQGIPAGSPTKRLTELLSESLDAQSENTQPPGAVTTGDASETPVAETPAVKRGQPRKKRPSA